MASAFNLTAQINLQGPANLRTVVADIRRQLGSITVDINPQINASAARNVAGLANDLRNLNNTLNTTVISSRNAAQAINNLGNAINSVGGRNIQQNMSAATAAAQNLSRNITSVGQNTQRAATQMEEFGRQSALAIRRFAAFSIVTSAVYSLINAVSKGVDEFVKFDKEFVRLQQVTGESAKGLQSLASEISRLATQYGVASNSLTQVSVTLAQAGLTAGDTKRALEALAQSALSPSFDDMNETVEGSIALMRQFGISATDLGKALGSVSAVSAQFAVEASDIITAIQRTGGVFATASKGVSQGSEALNEFIALFTSVRQTTRESAETIATGLRTIFTRIQRADTIDALKEFGVTLTDLEGKFVGPFEAVKRLSIGLKSLDPRDLRFSAIVEELGGFRQIGKVIPLIQQFAVAQQALKVAQQGQGILAKDAATAQLSLANQIAKVREEFLALIRSIGESDSFRSFVRLSLDLASALIRVADAAKDVLPAIAAISTIKGISALTQFGSGFARGLTRPRGFATGGYVPGSGNRDTVPAMLTPGEFVIRKKAVETIGVNRLQNLNKYASGGSVQKFARGSFAMPKGRGITGARGARSRFKDLTEEELAQLSTADMIKYAKAQARDIFSTGGAGIATSSKFIPVPKERITPELESSLTSYLGQRGFWKEVVSPFGKPSKSAVKAQGKVSREEALKRQQARMADEVAARSQQWTNIRSGSAIDNYLLSSLKDPVLADYRTVRGGGSLSKPFYNTRLRQSVNKALETYDDFDYSAGNIDKLVSNFAARRFSFGGMVQKFAKGGMIERKINKNMGDIKTGPRMFGLVGLRSGLSDSQGLPTSLQQKTKTPKNRDIQLSIGTLSNSYKNNLDNQIEDDLYQSFSTSVIQTANTLARQIGANTKPNQNKINKALKGSGFTTVVGAALESALGLIGSPYLDKTESTKALDFPLGLGQAASLFGIPPRIPTDVTRTVGGSGKGSTQILNQIDRFIDAVEAGDFTKAIQEKIRNRKGSNLSPLLSSVKEKLGDKPITAVAQAGIAFKLRKKYGLGRGGLNKPSLESSLFGLPTGQQRRFISDLDSVATTGTFADADMYAKGGSVDNVPALLTPGEFVINKKAASKLGASRLHSLNRADKIQGYNKGGFVDGVQKFARGGFGFPRTGTGSARPGGARAGTRDFTNQGAAVRENNPMGTIGSNILMNAYTAPIVGGLAIDSLSQSYGGETTSAGRYIGNVGSSTLNYASTGAMAGGMIGSFIPGVGNVAGGVIGGVVGGLYGLVDGLQKASQASTDYAEKVQNSNIERVASENAQAITSFSSNPTSGNREAALQALSRISSEENKLSIIRSKTDTDKTFAKRLASGQQTGAGAASQILNAEMARTGKTFDELRSSMNPTVMNQLITNIVEADQGYVLERERYNRLIQEQRDRGFPDSSIAALEKERANALSALTTEIINRTTIEGQGAVAALAAAKQQEMLQQAVERVMETYVSSFETFDQILNASSASIEQINQRLDKISRGLSGFSATSGLEQNINVLRNPKAFSEKERNAVFSSVSRSFPGMEKTFKSIADYGTNAEKAARESLKKVDTSNIDKGIVKENQAKAIKETFNKQIDEVFKGDQTLKNAVQTILDDAAKDAEKESSLNIDKVIKQIVETTGGALGSQVESLLIKSQQQLIDTFDKINASSQAIANINQGIIDRNAAFTAQTANNSMAYREALGMQISPQERLRLNLSSSAQRLGINLAPGQSLNANMIADRRSQLEQQRSTKEQELAKLTPDLEKNKSAINQLQQELAKLDSAIEITNQELEKFGDIVQSSIGETINQIADRAKTLEEAMAFRREDFISQITSTPEQRVEAATIQRLTRDAIGGNYNIGSSPGANKAYNEFMAPYRQEMAALQSIGAQFTPQAMQEVQRVLAEGERVRQQAFAQEIEQIVNNFQRTNRDPEDPKQRGQLAQLLQNLGRAQGIDPAITKQVAEEAQMNAEQRAAAFKADQKIIAFTSQLEDLYNKQAVANEALNQAAREREAVIQKDVVAPTLQAITENTTNLGAEIKRLSDAVTALAAAGGKPVLAVPKASGGLIYASKGMMVNYQPKGTDTVPAMLTPGEFVVNKDATQKNLGLLRSINSGSKAYSKGGVVYAASGGEILARYNSEVKKWEEDFAAKKARWIDKPPEFTTWLRNQGYNSGEQENAIRARGRSTIRATRDRENLQKPYIPPKPPTSPVLDTYNKYGPSSDADIQARFNTPVPERGGIKKIENNRLGQKIYYNDGTVEQLIQKDEVSNQNQALETLVVGPAIGKGINLVAKGLSRFIPKRIPSSVQPSKVVGQLEYTTPKPMNSVRGTGQFPRNLSPAAAANEQVLRGAGMPAAQARKEAIRAANAGQRYVRTPDGTVSRVSAKAVELKPEPPRLSPKDQAETIKRGQEATAANRAASKPKPKPTTPSQAEADAAAVVEAGSRTPMVPGVSRRSISAAKERIRNALIRNEKPDPKDLELVYGPRAVPSRTTNTAPTTTPAAVNPRPRTGVRAATAVAGAGVIGTGIGTVGNRFSSNQQATKPGVADQRNPPPPEQKKPQDVVVRPTTSVQSSPGSQSVPSIKDSPDLSPFRFEDIDPNGSKEYYKAVVARLDKELKTIPKALFYTTDWYRNVADPNYAYYKKMEELAKYRYGDPGYIGFMDSEKARILKEYNDKRSLALKRIQETASPFDPEYRTEEAVAPKPQTTTPSDTDNFRSMTKDAKPGKDVPITPKEARRRESERLDKAGISVQTMNMDMRAKVALLEKHFDAINKQINIPLSQRMAYVSSIGNNLLASDPTNPAILGLRNEYNTLDSLLITKDMLKLAYGLGAIPDINAGDLIAEAQKDITNRVTKASALLKFSGGRREFLQTGVPVAQQVKPQRRSNGGLIYASNGMMVPYEPRGTDTVPAMLTPGEFVVNREATQKNLGLLQAINKAGGGRIPMGDLQMLTETQRSGYYNISPEDESFLDGSVFRSRPWNRGGEKEATDKYYYYQKLFEEYWSRPDMRRYRSTPQGQAEYDKMRKLIATGFGLDAVGRPVFNNPFSKYGDPRSHAKDLETIFGRLPQGMAYSTPDNAPGGNAMMNQWRSNGGIVYASKGTLVNYQPRGTDTVPAMLTPGEFVVNRESTQKNLELLQSINKSRGGPIYARNGAEVGPGNTSSYSNTGAASVNFSIPQEIISQLQNLTTINLDPSALTSLNTFKTDFTNAVNTLQQLQINIPQKIEMAGFHQVAVTVDAPALENLMPGIEAMVTTLVSAKMEQIWSQSGGELGPTPSMMG